MIRSHRIAVAVVLIAVGVGAYAYQQHQQQSAQPVTPIALPDAPASDFGPTPQPQAGRVGPANLYPDPTLTPGKADTFDPADIQARWPCPHGAHPGHDGMCTYSAAHRSVSQSVKDEVCAAYEKLYPGITAYCQEPGYTHGAAQRCEVDHFCPVGVGCSNDKENLWIQRVDSVYCATENSCIPMGFRQKDALEAWGIAQVKAGRLDPREFDQRIWTDWVAYYLEVNPPTTNQSN